jgi:hypothetical protein
VRVTPLAVLQPSHSCVLHSYYLIANVSFTHAPPLPGRVCRDARVGGGRPSHPLPTHPLLPVCYWPAGPLLGRDAAERDAPSRRPARPGSSAWTKATHASTRYTIQGRVEKQASARVCGSHGTITATLPNWAPDFFGVHAAGAVHARVLAPPRGARARIIL